MSYIVSARKYRPSRFDEVVGQAHVAQTLKNALKNDKLAHAFLFCGPRGVGKTTCARILAKVLNCQQVTEDFEPCNSCDNCKAFQEHASFNIIELDAASNNSVEHIRTLTDQVRFQPQQGKYKVFIIDEVHMLSQSAFNAFLKTLEEPPPYAFFILATTEKHKIIPTILSRCQVFDFKRITVPDIMGHLKAISVKEQIEAEEDALHIIAQKGDGALRDALSLFDRIVSSTGGKITYDDVIENLNILDYDYFFRFTEALMTEDLPRVLNIFDEVLRGGFEPDIFLMGLGEHLRNLLVCQDEETVRLLEVSEGLQKRYLRQAKVARPAFLLSALNLISETDVHYKMARNKRLQVEMALIKITFLHRRMEVGAVPAVSTEKKKDEPSGQLTPELPKSEEEPDQPAPEPVEPVGPKSEEKASEPAEDPSGYGHPKDSEEDGSPPPEEKLPTPEAATEVSPPDSSASTEPSDSSGAAWKPAGTGDLPRLTDLSELLEEVEEEGDAGDRAGNELSLENVRNAWLEFTSTKDNHVRSVLEQAELTLEGDTVIATVASQLAQQTLLQEQELMTFLREQLNSPELERKVRIDTSKLAGNAPPPKSILTPKEKFLQMREVNPLVQDLVERLKLLSEED